ncbi:MAG: AraC family transcriptional regulator [Bacteroidota bacterium]
MKPEYELISELNQKSFVAKTISRENRPLLSQAWHYHPEIEVCLTLKSRGRRFVGNQIADYYENDLVMFGSNLPHGFTTEMKSKQLVVQMQPEFLGESFLGTPEMKNIKKLFNHSNSGLEFFGHTKEKASKIIKKMLRKDGMKQLLYLLELLNILSESKDRKEICPKEYSLNLNISELGRIKQVYDYIIENFREKVNVKDVADLINISEPAFFKFIKKHTSKTYTQIINEFRINHASRLIMNTDKNIAQISFESGFNNISYFNRKFKQIMNQTPLEFKNKYQASTINIESELNH